MTHSHAVVRIDHQHAKVLQFGADDLKDEKIQARTDHTRQHGSGVRTEHEFFGEVCDALAGVAEVLITGPHTAQSDFRHYVDKHRSAVALQIVGWETVDHPTDGQLLALAHQYFLKHDRLSGTAPLA